MAISYYNMEKENHRFHKEIVDECDSRISYLKSQQVSFTTFKTGCLVTIYSSHNLNINSSLDSVIAAHPYHQMLYDSDTHTPFRLLNNCNVDVDTFFMEDLNNLFIWPIEMTLFSDTYFSAIPSMVTIRNNFNVLRNCSFQNKVIIDNPITENQLFHKARDQPLNPENSSILRYVEDYYSLKEFLLPDRNILTRLSTMYLYPSPVVIAYSLTNSVLLGKLNKGSTLVRRLDEFRENYQYQCSGHSAVHDCIAAQLKKPDQVLSIETICNYKESH